MLASEEITSCLSPDVYSMVCKLGQEEEEDERLDIYTLITEDGKLLWVNFANYVCYHSPDGTLDYIKSVRLLRPACKMVHLHLMSITACFFKEKYEVWFEWTNNTQVFLEVFDLLRSKEVTTLSLALMKLTSLLERALGDVHLLVSRECPFLLRDLLASQELAKIFGQPVMDIFRVFLGSPKSLNLRNILWHGFAAPQEIPPEYCSMLLFFSGGLGQLLSDYLERTSSELVHRPYYSFTCLEELNIFPDVNDEILSVAEELIMKSKFVLKIMLPYWNAALMAFKQHRYADCVILLLPQIETGLRLVFTSLNNCQERLLTAESTTLYTTFDEMLAKQLNNGDLNQLPLKLGDPLLEFLWDFLNHQEGPRVRDHLSHGEVDLKVFPRCIASQLIAFAMVLLHQFCAEDSQENAVTGTLKKCASCYRSRFHPIGRLRYQVLNCIESLVKWDSLPVVPVDDIQSSVRLKDPADIKECSSLMDEIVSLTFSLMPVNFSWKREPVGELLGNKWPQILADLCSTHVPVLYCPRSVLEVVVVLRQIITQCHLVSDQVISTAENRHVQWINKALRSRQRQNYLRMLTCIQHLSPVSRLILLLVTMEMYNVYKVCEKSPSECLQYLKFLKAILQYVENLVTYTSPEKNKWDETMELTKKILLKIKLFYGKLTI
ncbi:endoplasmic reticulum membrane-associated RNA degradation protein [Protopterus annectens]|uniref:endoplasmic reticulum membrane-associated RNA degradation protein n=1 Tax=Protopterus annectens TaxID=7888 RepID=UPI001CFC0E4B|nr:endoplasmic reticulum membrane-associated RNA degradation protein [Protopterus annectens]XP_043923710.1 endoplasmic reticulum membrane-associated RNA degradation protein [Protopterus annectens]XP_043923717.1 endoplasmic reticulum membrane-associated RNA degradation protein [Protopterus annectens]